MSICLVLKCVAIVPATDDTPGRIEFEPGAVEGFQPKGEGSFALPVAAGWPGYWTDNFQVGRLYSWTLDEKHSLFLTRCTGGPPPLDQPAEPE